ncbi:MAG: hypothetical protein AAFY56_01555 [Pseudomonadota bacterium]
MPRQRLLYRRVFFWLWITPVLPWIVLAIVETMAAVGFDEGVDFASLGLPVVATMLLSLIFLPLTSFMSRRLVHPNDLALFTPEEQRKASYIFVLHTVLVAGVLQLPLIMSTQTAEFDPTSLETSTALVWGAGSFVISIVVAAFVGWHAIGQVRVD